MIQASAQVQEQPPKIILEWPATGGTQPIEIYRKNLASSSWGAPLAILAANAMRYEDTSGSVVVGRAFEYLLYQPESNNNSDLPDRFGFVYAGIHIPLVHQRGKLLLIVDQTIAPALAPELERLTFDLAGDGWQVIQHEVARTDSVVSVKALIESEYQADPGNVRALFLFGHVPVPYSGEFAPDAHADHVGAWPADAFYGELDGPWTDDTVSTTVAARTENHNIPGDGKYDQSRLPSDLELMVGRVDLANMNAFGVSEVELLRRYLDKNHAWRHGRIAVSARALVTDEFPAFSEGFAQNGWRMAALVGAENVGAGEWSALRTQNYLWAYGASPGFYVGSSMATTGDYAAHNYQAIFQGLFGSLFGDWDSNNNFLRAPLAQSTWGLATFWAGRPNWFMHPMVLGEPIGLSARLATTSGRYPMGAFARGVHVALMGDPTLRMKYFSPPSDLEALMDLTGVVHLAWVASPAESVLGYHIYRSNQANGPYLRMTSDPSVGMQYIDSEPDGASHYMVRAVRLETSPGGAYRNASQGIMAMVGSRNSVDPALWTILR